MAFGKFGRYYPDGVDVRVTRFDLVGLLRAELDELAAGEGAAHRLRFSCDAPRSMVETDREHVRYIVLNLLQNAIKYSSPGTQVDLTLLTAGEQLELRVVDRGIGVPAAEVEALFSPFYRASNAASRPGTGMGLPIVKKSASLIGAAVALRTAVGEGSEFTVTFAR